MRVTSGFWVGSYLRRAAAEGCFCGVIKRGAEDAGAIFIVINHLDSCFSLFGPASQTAFGESDDADRKFSALLDRQPESLVLERLEREKKFDPDLWIIENENRAGLTLLDIAQDD